MISLFPRNFNIYITSSFDAVILERTTMNIVFQILPTQGIEKFVNFVTFYAL